MSTIHTAFGRVPCFVREWKRPVPSLRCPAMLPPLTSLASPSLPVPKPEREDLGVRGTACCVRWTDFLKGYSHRLQTAGLLIPRDRSGSMCWGDWNSEGTPA